jgi:hypothetical protein
VIAWFGSAERVGPRQASVAGDLQREHIGTSYIERSNLSMRKGMRRRFIRLASAFSEKFENHFHVLALYFTFENSYASTGGLRTREA